MRPKAVRNLVAPGPKGRSKRILYYAPSPDVSGHFLTTLESMPDAVTGSRGRELTVRFRDSSFTFLVRHDPSEAFEALHKAYFNLVILDLRMPKGRSWTLRKEAQRAVSILDQMDAESDVELRYAFDRILVLVSASDSRRIDELMVCLGRRGVGRVMRDDTVCHLDPSCPRLPHHSHFGRAVLDEALLLMSGRKERKRALCCAGGGTTGIYFELGALKCLEDCLPPGALYTFDAYYGISAGAVITGFLSQGYSISEVMGGIAGVSGNRIPPFSMSLLRPQHLNLGGLVDPLWHLVRGAASGALSLLRGERRPALETLFLDYTDLLVAPFRADAFERMMRAAFTAHGAANDFRKLERPLYIGATDQDERKHVLFGQSPDDDVPISQAIQASISINPFFCSTRIGGRNYVDGALTRTSNFIEAIRKGADLIFAIDPFVPYVSKSPGYARAKGALYNVDQDVRTLSFTRFETNRYWVLRRHPEVSLYTFLPANRLRQVMSVNPMDHRPYLEIWRGAYLSTLKRLQKVAHRLEGDLAFHGLSLDTSVAEPIARRLESVEDLRFADFFPGRVVDVQPPVVPRAVAPVPGDAREPHAA